MIAITEKAATEFQKLLEQEKKQEYGLRIFIAGVACGGIQYGLSLEEKPSENDKVVESNGVKIIVAQNIELHLNGSEIDYINTPDGSGFIIRNPNAPSCGPGCSSCH